VASYKSTLQSMAHSAVGILELKLGEDAGAERDLTAAAKLNTAQPDAYVWYHLAALVSPCRGAAGKHRV
jgi:hypothetical protein